MQDSTKYEISFLNALFLTIAYFVICLIIPTAIDTLIWKKTVGDISTWLNILTLIIISCIFFFYLSHRIQYKIDFHKNITPVNTLIAIGCSILFFLLLDKFLDPIFDKMFSTSAIAYQETLNTLRLSPATTFIRVCLFAPITEEILMRGYVLNGLQNKYGVMVALVITTFLFAILHFNYVQTLSAVICGLVIGLLYIKTNSVACCILTHALYNSISFFTMVV